MHINQNSFDHDEKSRWKSFAISNSKQKKVICNLLGHADKYTFVHNVDKREEGRERER